MKLTRLLALAAIGTGIALLFTTKKGKELRGDIADKSDDLMKQLNKLSKKTISDMKKVGSKATNGVKEVV